MAVSATYLGNRMMNLWGDVTGNPGFPPGVADGPVHAETRRPGRRRSRTARQAPLDLRREMTQADPRSDIHRLPRLVHRSRLAAVQRPAAVGAAPRGERPDDQRQLHALEVRGLMTAGRRPLERRHWLHGAGVDLNPPADADEWLDTDEGACDNYRRHIFNLTASGRRRRISTTPSHA